MKPKYIKFKYTRKAHSIQMLRLLDMEYSCRECPLVMLKKDVGGYRFLSPKLKEKICKTCTEYVGITPETIDHSKTFCPCYQLGGKEALKRTWLALERDGYV